MRCASTMLLNYIRVFYIECPITETRISEKLQKPDILTTYSQSDCLKHTKLYYKDLTPAFDGQDFPTKGGQGHRLPSQPFKLSEEVLFFIEIARINQYQISLNYVFPHRGIDIINFQSFHIIFKFSPVVDRIAIIEYIIDNTN